MTNSCLSEIWGNPVGESINFEKLRFSIGRDASIGQGVVVRIPKLESRSSKCHMSAGCGSSQCATSIKNSNCSK